jgi:hypothetical protein
MVRMLIRKSAFYVMNEPLAGTDAHLQDRIIGSVLSFLAEQPQPPGVVWILANDQLAHHFGRTAEFAQGRLVDKTAGTDRRKAAATATSQAAS